MGKRADYKRYHVNLTSREGHATFGKKPSEEAITLVNKLADIAYYKVRKKDKMNLDINITDSEKVAFLQKRGYVVARKQLNMPGNIKGTLRGKMNELLAYSAGDLDIDKTIASNNYVYCIEKYGFDSVFSREFKKALLNL